MYILATIGDWDDRKGFERRAVRALGHRGHVVTVLSGCKAGVVRKHNRDKQIASGERWVLWWDDKDGKPAPFQGAGELVRSRQSVPQ